MIDQVFLTKAEEALAGAESEFTNNRYNNCANRCYYACFQAAVSALIKSDIVPKGKQWGHEFVQGEFVGQLVNKRKYYKTELRQVLANTLALRQKADYRGDHVNRREVSHAIAWTRVFVSSVRERETNEES